MIVYHEYYEKIRPSLAVSIGVSYISRDCLQIGKYWLGYKTTQNVSDNHSVIYIYIYICVCVCVCVCDLPRFQSYQNHPSVSDMDSYMYVLNHTFDHMFVLVILVLWFWCFRYRDHQCEMCIPALHLLGIAEMIGIFSKKNSGLNMVNMGHRSPYVPHRKALKSMGIANHVRYKHFECWMNVGDVSQLVIQSSHCTKEP